MIQTLDALRRGELAGARELRLRERLTEFPREIFDLAETLEVLDLSGGALTELPDDLGRLGKLRVLFCSGNRFERLPPSLGDCAALSQVGFRGCGIREVPAEALPPNLRWLTLTDNAIEVLPEAIGRRPALQKVMLAGNRLEALPESLRATPGWNCCAWRPIGSRPCRPGWPSCPAWPGWPGPATRSTTARPWPRPRSPGPRCVRAAGWGPARRATSMRRCGPTAAKPAPSP